MSGVVRNGYRLYVANLPWTVGTTELRQYFSKFGHINLAQVVFDKNTGFSKNYGFVTFASKQAFDSALNKGAHQLEGNNIRIQPVNTNLNN